MVPYANQRGLDGGFSGRHYMAMSRHPLTNQIHPPLQIPSCTNVKMSYDLVKDRKIVWKLTCKDVKMQ